MTGSTFSACWWRWTVILLGATLSISPQVLAQDFSAKNQAVLKPQSDVNGVDMVSGGYLTASPFTFEAPGAGHLNVRTSFNGRRLSFSLNVYLDDQTYTRWDVGDPNERHIRVHLGGTDKLFTCYNSGPCTQIAEIDGSILNRISADQYIFKDREGATYTFFNLAYQPLAPCYDVESGCNNAGYNAYAYVSMIQYPSGEKLIYQPLPVVSGGSGNYTVSDTITSNLGYKLVLSRTSSSYTQPTVAGQSWLFYRPSTTSVTFTLFNNNISLSSLTSNLVVTGDYRDAVLTQQDGLGRIYRLDLHADPAMMCPATVDYTFLLPKTVTSPGGVITNIAYHDLSSNNPGLNNVPVKTVTRGGQIWQYDKRVGGKTTTDPSGDTLSVVSGWAESGYDYGESANCGQGQVLPRITRVTNELNKPTNYEYGNYGPSKATLPESNGFLYDYDTRGNLTKATQVAKPGSGLANRVTYQAGFSATCANPITCNKPNWVKDGNGNQSDYTYDATHGGVLTATLPGLPNGVSPQMRYTYSSHDTGNGIIHRLTQTSTCITGSNCAGTANEEKTTTTYWNGTFLPATITKSAGNDSVSSSKSFDYDTAGRQIQVTDPRGNATAYLYDSAGRKIGEISPDPDGAGPLPRLAKRIAYNGDDQPTKIEEGTVTGTNATALAAMTVSQYVETTYDSAGRKANERIMVGNSIHALTQFSYTADGRLECSAVRMNSDLFGLPPANACILGTAGSSGADRITKNVYDAAGQLLKVQKAFGTPIQQDYAVNSYSNNGKQISVTDANGNKASFVFDGYDQKTHWYFPSKTITGQASTTDYEQYSYDANGNRTSLRKRDGQVIGYSYDALNRVAVKDVPGTTKDVFYSYDLRGLQTLAKFNDASKYVSAAYDALGRLTSSANNMGTGYLSVSYLYDAKGNRTRITHPDGPYFTYEYDGLDRLIRIRENGGTELVGIGYNNKGERTCQGNTVNVSACGGSTVTNYAYDGVSRLTSYGHDLSGANSDIVTGLVYNPASQITGMTRSNSAYAWNGHINVNRSYGVNGLNQYTSAGPASFTYDGNGNLTSDGSTAYVYDAENRLTSTSGAKTANLAYDPQGRLWETAGNGVTTRFLYDGDELIAEYASNGMLLRRYIHGVGSDDPLMWYEAGQSWPSGLRRIHTDHQGSVTAIANGAGAMLTINSYDEYGIPASGNLGRFQYTGQAWLPEIGMYYYKARIYSPTLGRFLQTDPIGYDDQINLYAYVANDPVNRRDPTGKYTCSGSKENCAGVSAALQRGRDALASGKLSKSDAARVSGVLKTYGKEGVRNGVGVTFLSRDALRAKSAGAAFTKYDKQRGVSLVVLPDNFSKFGNSFASDRMATGATADQVKGFSPQDERANTVFHEGQHARDQQALGRSLTPSEAHPSAYRTGEAINRAFGSSSTRQISNEITGGDDYEY